MMQNWSKQITTKNEDDKKNSKIYRKGTINGYVYVEKLSPLKKSMAYNIG